uniref:B box-type domain-containing protein n=1 Tax=Phlebotomus papatasi TaxID=29031 RepID=A0A1B0D791_PHLPP
MRVIIFDQSGNVLQKFGCSKHLEFPNGVVVNDKQEIFISDNRAHCVKVFNYEGVFLRQIGGEGITNYPIGVGINAAGEILIADNHNNFNLTIFTQDGQLVSALESKVKHAQCFDVALMDDGSVVLASKDYRLYIYRKYLVSLFHDQSFYNAKTLSQSVLVTKSQEHIDKVLQSCEFVERLTKHAGLAETIMLRKLMENKLQSFMGYIQDLQSTYELEFVSNYQAIQVGVRNTFGYIRSSSEAPTKQPPIARPTSNSILTNGSSPTSSTGSLNVNIQPQSQGHILTNGCHAIDRPFANGTTSSIIQPQPQTQSTMSFDSNIISKRFNSVNSLGPFVGDVNIQVNPYEKWSNGGSDNIFNSLSDQYTIPLAPGNQGATDSVIDLTSKLMSTSIFPPKSQIKRQKMIYHCKFGEFGVMEGQFTEPSGVAVNAQNDIIVADTNNHRIQIFDKEGRFKFQFGECGKRDGQLLYPNRVAVVRTSGDIIVTERSPTHQIQIYNQYGQFVRKFGANILQHPRATNSIRSFGEQTDYLSDSPLTLSGSSPTVSDSAICDDFPLNGLESSSAPSSQTASSSERVICPRCTGCKSKQLDAVAKCIDCANYLCSNCVTAHQFMHCFDGHSVFRIGSDGQLQATVSSQQHPSQLHQQVDIMNGFESHRLALSLKDETSLLNKANNMTSLLVDGGGLLGGPTSSNTAAPTKPTNSYFCTRHKSELLKFYCRTCSVTVCKDCIVADHPSGLHDCEHVNDGTPKQIESLLQLVTDVRGKATDMRAMVKNAEHNTARIQVQYHKAQTEINETHNFYRSLLDDRKQDLLKELESLSLSLPFRCLSNKAVMF